MTSTETPDPVASIFAGLDAMPTPAAKPARGKFKLSTTGITSGQPRVEMNRPKYGKQAQALVPINKLGQLAGGDALEQLIAGRSRRYAQDLEGWARASLADHAERGVLVVWDGMFYTITLDPASPPRTITEVHKRDLSAWRVAQAQ